MGLERRKEERLLHNAWFRKGEMRVNMKRKPEEGRKMRRNRTEVQ